MDMKKNNKITNRAKRKKYAFRDAVTTTTARIIMIIVTLVIPINIISLVLLANNFYVARRRAEREITSELELAAEKMQSEFGTIKKSLLYETFDNEYFTSLMDREITDPTKKYNAILNVTNTLKQIQVIQNQINTVYFYFPNNDTYVTYGSPGLVQSKLIDMLSRFVEDENKKSSIWEIYKENETPLLILREKQRNFTYGIVLQLNQASNRISASKENARQETFLGNEDGSIISLDGAVFLSKIGKNIENLDNSRVYFKSKVPVGDTGLYIYKVISYREIDSASGIATRVFMILLSIFTIATIPILIVQMRRLVIRPLEELNDAMDIIESGETDYRIEKEATGLEFRHINASFNAMLDQLEELKIDVYEHEIEERNIRLEYLSQQVQPHFILNALNILYSYEPEEYDLAQKMIMCISKYFRHIVYANDKFVSLKSEMDHVSNYFEIQKARFPDLFYSIVEYDEIIAEALIPPLVLQTFAENAIKNSLKIGNRITIFMIADKYDEDGQSYIRVRIADTGEGIPDEILAEIEDFEKTGVKQEHLGVGIQNSIERFKVIYGDLAKISFSRDETYPGTNVEILLPVHYRGEAPILEEFV